MPRSASAAADAARWDTAACQLFADAVQQFGAQELKAGGSSMRPAIWPGDRLVIQAADSTQISIGDVVAFRRGSAIVAHRVVAAADGAASSHLLTRGDRLSDVDEPIAPSALLGRVMVVRRGPFLVDPARPVPLGWRAVSALFETAYACRRHLALAWRFARAFGRLEYRAAS